MKFIITVMLLISSHSFAQKESSGHYVLLLNGGHDTFSNNPRYLENIRAMYEAYRENEVSSDKIAVLYGSGKVDDTLGQAPQFGAPGGGSYGYPVSAGGGMTGGSYSVPTGGGMTGGSYSVPTGGGMTGGSYSVPTGGGMTSGSSLASTGGMAGGSDPASTSKTSKSSLEYLFNGEKREIDGEAKKTKLREKIRQIKDQLKPGDDISLFITDHGSRSDANDETLINLWGEVISTSELGELLREIPSSSKIRIVTNICYGGGLNDLTSKNVCVFSNQQKGIPSFSKSSDLDLYAQNFAFALKNKLDIDKDGKPTYMDAHQYAVSLDQDTNVPMTSLDWFLNKNKNKILDLKREHEEAKALACIIPQEESFEELKNLIENFDVLKSKLTVNDGDIPSSHKKYLKGHLEKRIQKYQNNETSELLNNLDIKLNALKKSLEESAADWDKLAPEQQVNYKKKAMLEAQQLRGQIVALEKEKKQYESLNLELDLLRYGDKHMIAEYEQITGCLDYEY